MGVKHGIVRRSIPSRETFAHHHRAILLEGNNRIGEQFEQTQASIHGELPLLVAVTVVDNR